MIEVGQNYTVKCADISVEGLGISRCDEGVVFVENMLPGEEAIVSVDEKNGNIFKGHVERLTESSRDRVEPLCPYFGICGGCTLQNLSYEAQRSYKKKHINDCLSRIGDIEEKVENIQSGERIFEYRNKASFPVRQKNGRKIVGFLASDGKSIVEIEKCLLIDDSFNRIRAVFEEYLNAYKISVYNYVKHTGLVRRLTIRKSYDDRIIVMIEINGDDLPKKEILIERLSSIENIEGIVLGINRLRKADNIISSVRKIYGKDEIIETINGVRYHVSPVSFMQVNHEVTEKLYSTAVSLAKDMNAERIIDLYCGIGSIGLQFSNFVKEIVGVDIVKEAVENAKRNIRLNGFENAEYICDDAYKGIKNIKLNKKDYLILDPPRKGCSTELLKLIIDNGIENIIYISCNPATLARDLKILKEHYSIRHLEAFDMFPQTMHVETVCLLSKKNS